LGAVKLRGGLVFGVLLVESQSLYGFELHDEHQVPAARIVEYVVADFKLLNFSDASRQREHFLTKCLYVLGWCIGVIFYKNIVVQHQ